MPTCRGATKWWARGRDRRHLCTCWHRTPAAGRQSSAISTTRRDGLLSHRTVNGRSRSSPIAHAVMPSKSRTAEVQRSSRRSRAGSREARHPAAVGVRHPRASRDDERRLPGHVNRLPPRGIEDRIRLVFHAESGAITVPRTRRRCARSTAMAPGADLDADEAGRAAEPVLDWACLAAVGARCRFRLGRGDRARRGSRCGRRRGLPRRRRWGCRSGIRDCAGRK